LAEIDVRDRRRGVELRLIVAEAARAHAAHLDRAFRRPDVAAPVLDRHDDVDRQLGAADLLRGRQVLQHAAVPRDPRVQRAAFADRLDAQLAVRRERRRRRVSARRPVSSTDSSVPKKPSRLTACTASPTLQQFFDMGAYRIRRGC
jgi:hypothetical protein